MTFEELKQAWKDADKHDYKTAKENLEELAKQWQYEFSEETYFWSDLCDFEDFFLTNGKRYGLLTVFKENAIV